MSGTTALPARTRTGLDPPTDRMALLAGLLALAVLFHQQQLGSWSVTSPSLLVTLAAVWLLLRPSSPRRLVCLVLAHVASTLWDLPLVSNHWLLMLLAEVGALIAIGVGLLRRQGWVRDPGEVFLRLAPALRVQFLLVYLLAALAKVNRDFLDREQSCGVAMVDGLLARVPFGLAGEWTSTAVIVGTIAVEALLPIGLAWRRTRVLAVFAALGFHLVLALLGHVPFSAFALVYLSLFVPDDLLVRARLVLERAPRLAALVRTVRRGAGSRRVSGLALGLVLVVAVGYEQLGLADSIRTVFNLLFLLYFGAATAALLACLLVRRHRQWRPAPLRLASPVWLIGPLLVVANAASPYLGGKTQTTFTMYSNLQTEGAYWNSLVVPESVQLFASQDRLVRIVASSDPRLQEAADTNRLWVWTGLRAWAQRHPDASLSYEDAGVLHEVARVGDDPRLGMNWLVSRLATYRDVPVGDGNTCRTQRERAGEQQS